MSNHYLFLDAMMLFLNCDNVKVIDAILWAHGPALCNAGKI